MGKSEIKVLLIDDDPNIAGLIKYYLNSYRNYSFKVDWAETVMNGLEKISTGNNSYNLILLDYYLPEINGIEALKILKSRGINIPVILLSGSMENELVAVEALKLGAVEYYIKEDIIGPLLPMIIASVVEKENLKRQIEKDRGEQKQKIEAIQEIVITVSHEVNNPLAAIKLAANILLKKELPADIKTYIKIIKDNTDRIEQTILKLRELKSDQIVPYVGKLKMLDLSEPKKKETKDE
jgi:DNA-binding response OmpR family regulator